MITDYKNTKITEYNDFISIVSDIGFMPLSNNSIDFINLSGLTKPEQWHTELPSDPWPWRVKIEEDHKAVYAKLFDKKPGFISIEWIALFLAARRKGHGFNEIYRDGVISNYAKQIYTLFERYKILAVHEIKAMVGVSKDTNSKFESAMSELQMGMFITTNGMKQKISSAGEPYGWPSTAYSTIETWVGEEVMNASNHISPNDAMDEILLRIYDISPCRDPKKLKRFTGF